MLPIHVDEYEGNILFGRVSGERALMQLHKLYSSLAIENDYKIVVLVIDGLGGMSHKDYGYKTELEYANHPNLDELASRGTTGMLTPVLPGVTPGSGPAHLGLFGFDPIFFKIGRGIFRGTGDRPCPSTHRCLGAWQFLYRR